MYNPVLNMDGHACCVAPLSRHEFKVSDPNQFECDVCQKPRAMHIHDGFKPNHSQPHICMDYSCRFGVHPYFWKPGTLKEEKPKHIQRHARQLSHGQLDRHSGETKTLRYAGPVTTRDEGVETTIRSRPPVSINSTS